MATTTIAKLLVEIGIKTKEFEKNIRNVEKNIHGMQSKFNNVGKTIGRVAKVIAAGWITKKVIKASSDFQFSLSQLGVIANVSGKDLQKLGNSAQQMAVEFGTSTQDVIKGLTEMKRLGFETESALQAMPDLLRFAKANSADFTATIGLAEATLNDFNLGLNDLPKTLDIFSVALSKGQMKMGDLRNTFKRAAPVAFGAKIRIEELSAATSILARAGFKGEKSGRALNRIMQELTSPSKKAAEQFKKIGFNIMTDSGLTKSFTQKIAELQEKTKGLTGEQRIQFAQLAAGRDHMDKFLALIDGAPGSFEKMVQEMDNATGRTQTFFEAMSKTSKFKMDQVTEGITVLAQKIGTVLGPVFEDLLDKTREWIDALLKADWNQIGEDIKQVWEDIKDAFNLSADQALNTFTNFKDDVSNLLKDLAKIMGIESNKMASDWAEAWIWISTSVSNAFDVISGIISNIIRLITGVASALIKLKNLDFSGAYSAVKDMAGSIGKDVMTRANRISERSTIAKGAIDKHRTGSDKDTSPGQRAINNTFNIHSRNVDGRSIQRHMDRAAMRRGFGF